MSSIDPEAVFDALQNSSGKNAGGQPADKNTRGMHLAELSSRLGLTRADRGAMLEALDTLVADDRVHELPGRRFRLGKTKSVATAARLEGYLFVHPRGFGFVTAEDGGPDVFIPPPFLGAALHGDRVEVTTKPGPKGREGAVVGVLSRRPARVTGILQRDRRENLFLPDDVRLRSPMRIDGGLPDGAEAGSVLVADIVGFPQDEYESCVVQVRELLGAEGVAQVEAARILVREGVEEDFDRLALAEAAALPNHVLASEREGREDLREMQLVTIDPPDAKDHDDALFAERLPKGGYRVVVAIADVSHYVAEGTALDAAAEARGVSIYLPSRSIPMLPREISSGIASLVPNEDRLCLAVEVELSSRGKVRSLRFIEGVMRSSARLTYETAARALGLTEEGNVSPEASAHLELLETLLEISRLLRSSRMKRGALDFDLPEPKVIFDDAGQPKDVVRSRKDPGIREAYRLVEEMMLLANEVVATELSARKLPAIYRVHGAPDEDKLELFAQLACSLGFDLDVEQAKDPKHLTSFLARIDGLPEAPVLRYLLLRAMQQAIYDITPAAGHFGLAAPDYLHFTSPIRRYPDLTVHRVVRSAAREQRVDSATLRPYLRKAAADASRLERRAMSAERDVVSVYRTLVMRDRVGEVFDATITGTTDSGFYAALDEPFVETFTSVTRLEGDFFELDRLGIRLTGFRSGRSFTLGDRVRMRIEEVSLTRREIAAAPEDLPPAGTNPPEARGRGKPSDRRGGSQKDTRRSGSKNDARPGGPSKGAPKKAKKRGASPDDERAGSRQRRGGSSGAKKKRRR